MIQVIGLLIAVYAMARMIQVPIEMTGAKETYLGLPLWGRLAIVAGVSIAAVVVLGVLTLMLLFTGVDLPRAGKL
jgi:hypothetical protein